MFLRVVITKNYHFHANLFSGLWENVLTFTNTCFLKLVHITLLN